MPPSLTSSFDETARAGALPRVLEPEVMEGDLEARDYDEMDLGEVNARFVADLLAVKPDVSRTIDVGTGTALIPIALCTQRPQAHVLGVDLARSMLSLARRNVERAGLSGVITIERRDAKGLGYDDNAFTCVVSNSLVHHIPEPHGLFAEMARVLAPGGWLFIRDLGRPSDEAQIAHLVETYAGLANSRQRDLFEASMRAALTPVEVAMLLPERVSGAQVSMTSDRHWTLAWKKPG